MFFSGINKLIHDDNDDDDNKLTEMNSACRNQWVTGL